MEILGMSRPGTTLRTLFALAILVPLPALGLLGCSQQPESEAPAAPRPTKTLTILTPHNAAIRDTFASGFWNHYLEAHDQPVRINWIYRGTPQCVEYMRQYNAMKASGARYEEPDLMFGGGITDHARLASEGFSRSTDESIVADLPQTVNGSPTRGPDGAWIATGLSSFGIFYNAAACQRRGIAPPQTWADLADPRFAGWIAVADPRASGSHRECLMLIIKHHGWDTGWALITKILANTRALNARSGDALKQVQTGTALATFAVNFDGLARAAGSDGALAYVDPPGATAATPDILSVLRTSRHPDMAEAFVRYVLSPEGQALWGVKIEHRAAHGETLYHYPILPAIYAKEQDHLAVTRNPLKEDFGVKVDPAEAQWVGTLLKPLVAAACYGDNHVRLQQAWARLSSGEQPAALATLTSPPFSWETAAQKSKAFRDADEAARDQMLEAWAREFAERYAEAQAAAN
jgi:iron(III) transport system substrate-binding protein